MEKTYIRTAFLWTLFVVFENGTAAQAPPSTFSFGATMEDTYKVFGPPAQWYTLDSGRFLNSTVERDTALQVYDAAFPSSSVFGVEDVYMRQTSTNQYRIKVVWLQDRTASRLRPTMRLSALEMEVDKPAPAAVILGDLGEAVEICKAGCDLYVGGDELPAGCVLAFPSKPSSVEVQMGALLATNFQSKESKNQWSVGVKLVPENEAPGDPLKRKIATIVVRTAYAGPNLSIDPLLYTSGILKTPAKIGTWIPKSH